MSLSPSSIGFRPWFGRIFDHRGDTAEVEAQVVACRACKNIVDYRRQTVFGEGPSELDLSSHYNDHEYTFTAQDLRFTRKGKTLYVIFMDWPGDRKEATVRALHSGQGSRIRSVSMLASGERLAWRQDDQGLHVTLPGARVGDFAYVLKVER